MRCSQIRTLPVTVTLLHPGVSVKTYGQQQNRVTRVSPKIWTTLKIKNAVSDGEWKRRRWRKWIKLFVASKTGSSLIVCKRSYFFQIFWKRTRSSTTTTCSFRTAKVTVPGLETFWWRLSRKTGKKFALTFEISLLEYRSQKTSLKPSWRVKWQFLFSRPVSLKVSGANTRVGTRWVCLWRRLKVGQLYGIFLP